MARNKSNEEPIVLDEQEAAKENPVNEAPANEAPANEAPETEAPEAEAPAKAAPAKKAPKETPIEHQVTAKNVKIHTLEEVDCWIGGVHYQFRKDRDFSVPSDVASVLVNARKVYRV